MGHESILLRELIGSKLADGTLPTGKIGAVSASYGAGEVCDACAQKVSPPDILYQVDRADFRRIHFHRACFSVWRVQRARAGAAQPLPSRADQW